MSSVQTRLIQPQSGTTVTLGEAGDTVAVTAGAAVKTSIVKDSGGNILWQSDGAGTYSNINSAVEGSMTFISSQTGTAITNMTFTTPPGWDEYIFHFISLHPNTDAVFFSFGAGASIGNIPYGISKTTTYFRAGHTSANDWTGLGYIATADHASSAAYQYLSEQLAGGTGADDIDGCCSGELHIFGCGTDEYNNPSVKHFYGRNSGTSLDPGEGDAYVAGYFNHANGVMGAVDFTMSSGTFNGTIAMYGVR